MSVNVTDLQIFLIFSGEGILSYYYSGEGIRVLAYYYSWRAEVVLLLECVLQFL
jgi:hypothetical protein